jgi:regulator of sigma E protease
VIETPGFFWSLVFFFVAIGPLIFIHEMGHYLVGRWCGVKADVFSIGFGREIFGWNDKRGTRWKLSLLPLGGYVKFAGDMSAASEPTEEWKALPEAERAVTFQAQPLWQRAAIVAAGPITNLLLAVLIFMALIGYYGQARTPSVISAVAPGSAAAVAGFVAGDRVTAIGDTKVSQFDQISDVVVLRPGVAMSFTVDRGGVERTIIAAPAEKVVTDRFGNVSKLGQLGISSGPVISVKVPPLELPVVAVMQTWRVLKSMVDGLGQIIWGRVSVKELGGPLKIAKYSGQMATLGFAAFLSFVALISINLGFINLLPIPMLDGGHLTFYTIEAILRRPVSAQVQEWAFRAGFAILIGFMVLVNFNDLESFGVFEGLSRLIG